ncbi:SDR family NAD(P)-dependent oxidoreductase [Streptomyces sp. NPDC060065]|uniref:SDR family NAD(P)-dependent oxidoreductase n=1 Tax=Streptomyces sp. NPDC060065 TaxID=3347050 RepID=UPI0036C747CB
MNTARKTTARRLLGRLPWIDPGRAPLPARTAFVTGASSGIGRALAAELCTRGYDVYLTARRTAALEDLRAELAATHPRRTVALAALDVTDHEAVVKTLDDAAAALGGIGVVFANAGTDADGNIGTGHFETHRAVIDVNFIGAMATIDAATALFRRQGGGQIVGISSVAASAGLPGGAPYSSSKAALSTYLQSLRAETWKEAITVTTIAPGYIDTPINEAMGDKRRFLIDTSAGARKIMDRVEAGARTAAVPRFPWAFVGYLLRRAPDSVIARAAT